MFERLDFTRLYLIWRPHYKSRIWKIYFYFFHHDLNLFICCKTKLKIKFIFHWMSLFKQNEFFYRLEFPLTELNFLKEDENICFECITLFEKKKIFTEKNKIFVRIISIFILKIYFFCQIVLLHLNNHKLHDKNYFSKSS